jgi:hypothetical protein
MALVGYARVSSVGQSLEVPLDKLKHCDKIYQEKKAARRASGLDSKPAWNTSEKAIHWWSRAWIGWRGQPPSSTFLIDEKGCLFWLFGNCRENETGFNTHPNVFNDLAGQAKGFCSRFHGNYLKGPGLLHRGEGE